MNGSSSDRDRLKRRNESEARDVIVIDGDDDDNDRSAPATTTTPLRDDNRAASTTLLGPTPPSDPRDSRDNDNAVAEASKRRRKITVRHVKDLHEESVFEFDLSQFERQSTGALDVLVPTLTWDEYVRLASFSSVGYQRFLGIEPGALGIFTGENRDQRDIVPDNLVYYEGVKEFLRRDYGIAYAENDCTAVKTFERRMVSQALTKYAPPPRADNDVSKLETLIKLRRLYIWLVALGRNPPRSAAMIKRATDGQLFIAANLGGGIITFFVASYFHDDNTTDERGSVSFMCTTIIDVFRVVAAANQTDVHQTIQDLVQNSFLLRDDLKIHLKYDGPTSRKIITGIYNHEGKRWNTSPHPQNTLFLAYGMNNVVEIGNVLFIFERPLLDDVWHIIRFDQGTAQLPMTEWQIREPQHMSRIGVIDDRVFLNTPMFVGPSFVVGLINYPDKLHGDIYLMNMDPRGSSHLIHFREPGQNANIFTFPLLDEHERVYWRVVVYHQIIRYIDVPDSSGEVTIQRFRFLIFVVLDLDAISGAVRNIRSYVWVTQYWFGGNMFTPFELHQDRFLICSKVPTLDTDHMVFDSDTGTMAFYSQREYFDDDVGDVKPVLAYELENAPPLPNNWQQYFAHQELGAEELVVIGENRIQLPPSNAVVLVEVRATVGSTTFAYGKTVPLYSELDLSRNEALAAVLSGDSHGDVESIGNIIF